MKTLNKLHQARLKIKNTPIEKKGNNTFSKYMYFTPDQISQLVSEVNEEFKLFSKFDLVRTELGLMARLEIFDLESEDSVQFQIATDIPEIKATNIAQQLGGCVTYSERYLLQIAYDIKDNNLDFDSQDNRPKKKADKPILNPDSEKWPSAIDYLRKGNKVKGITDSYEITEENIQTLILAAEL